MALLKTTSLPLPPENYHEGWTRDPWLIVCHYSAGYTARQCHRALLDRGLSVHCTIERNGEVFNHVPTEHRCLHAGYGRWGGQAWLNNHALGFEAVNFGWGEGEVSADANVFDNDLRHPEDPEVFPEASGRRWFRVEEYNGSQFAVATRQAMYHHADHRPEHQMKLWAEYPVEQMDAVYAVIWQWVKRYSILLENVVGHEHVTPHRKMDPGPAWPWDDLARYMTVQAAREMTCLLDPSFNHSLRIKALQSHLARLGLAVGDIDGKWGPKTSDATAAALKRYSDVYTLPDLDIRPDNTLALCNAFRKVPGFDPGRGA